MTNLAFNFLESEVPDYTLPPLLTAPDGRTITSPGEWFSIQRPRLLELFRREVYGGVPDATVNVSAEALSYTEGALGNNAIRKQVRLAVWNGHRELEIILLIYLPKVASKSPVPVFLGLNFWGNHSIHPDPEILLSNKWIADDPEKGVSDHHATEKARGAWAHRWPLEDILQHGIGLATLYCGDLDPDFDDGFQNGIHPLYYRKGQSAPGEDEWGAISAWAWGLQKAMDYFEQDEEIDHLRVTLVGHSRLGKTALWAGAQDERFAAAISNNSGCMGAALSRRRFGETIEAINTTFPHWFCRNFKKYNNREEALEVDQHMLIALIAPRPVYIASAQDDLWADPRGEFLAAQATAPVYELFDREVVGFDEMPAVNSALIGPLGYHIRNGPHEITPYDWGQYIKFVEHHFMR